MAEYDIFILYYIKGLQLHCSKNFGNLDYREGWSFEALHIITGKAQAARLIKASFKYKCYILDIC